MSPDDPRHGTYAGAVAHWLEVSERPCPACHLAEGRYRKQRKMKHLRGEMVTFPAVGILRRIRALHAIGWSGHQVADACGLSVNTLRSIGYHQSGTVHAATAQSVMAGYERLSMAIPEGRYANRARASARRKGWAPPLAWDDIDDPDEQPAAWQWRPVHLRPAEEMLSELDHLLGLGVSIHQAARQLGVSVGAIEKAQERAA